MILVTLCGIVILVRLLQPSNIVFVMVVRLFDKLISLRLVQLANAEMPTSVTVSGIVTLVSALQLRNT